MYAITGSSGHLGRLAVIALLDRGVPADQIAALARTPAKASDLAALGVTVREADYDRPETLTPALAGVDRLLLVSSSEFGKRTAQHRAVIEAAQEAGVSLLVFTSILRADTSAIGLADEYRETESMLAESGIRTAIARNGGYTENYTESLGSAVAHGVVTGAAGDAPLSLATRADYAEAAVAILTADDPAGVYELAGDTGVTRADLAAEAARQSGKAIAYSDLPEAGYRAVLEGVGLPLPVAAMAAQVEAAARDGALFDDSRTLSGLIGRPTTPLADAVAAALAV